MSEGFARDLELLADLFRAGGWRELRVESDKLNILFSLDEGTNGLGTNASTVDRPTVSEVLPLVRPPSGGIEPRVRTASPSDTPSAEWHAVVAPNLGTFYRSPKPGSPPFVEIGQRVAANTEICLIEVMKLFTSVKAGVAGTIRRIDATDADLVEGGQTLFHIEPE